MAANRLGKQAKPAKSYGSCVLADRRCYERAGGSLSSPANSAAGNCAA